ncbi:MAG: T9SS type A sorting domain-containing protein [Bacteroidetes bacterium]|nr:MAG: T9SS type A sorting domain-containing protein [Bacteroidota bacterium]
MSRIKQFASLTIFFIGLNAFSQQPMQFGQVTDLNMVIANIFGIQCDGVSNVQLMAAPFQVGRFENGNSFGLSSGLVMSTGLITGSQMPSGLFNSTAIGVGGDNEIAQFGAAAGQTPSNFDACRIEFDFSPSSTDTIRFNYILASEEYPEYSMTSYTDRFLFLVSENGSPYVNIAFLPGTTTPVEINSVNQFVNPQYYNDNTAGPNAGNFVFDGYTVPFEAKFFAQLGSTYHIKLVIADVNDALYDSAIFLDEQQAYNDISGILSVNGSPAEGILEVFNFIGDTLLAQPVQTITVSNGNYLADSLQTGMYHVRFTPDPILFPGVAPLYYTSGQTWSDAVAIGLPCFLDNGNINSTSLSVLSGNGIIGGNIIIDTNYLKQPTQALENALVKLFNSNDQLVAFTYSDVDGNYQFSSLPIGTYYILLDLPYIPQINVHNISVTGNEVFSGADFAVLSDGINAVDNLIAGIGELDNNHFTLYPNPAHNELSIISDSENVYSIHSLSGQLIVSGLLIEGINQISVDNFSPGIYFVQVGLNGRRKLIIE